MLRVFFVIIMSLNLAACGIGHTMNKLITNPGYFDDPEAFLKDHRKDVYNAALAGDPEALLSAGIYIINFKSSNSDNCVRNFQRGNQMLVQAAEQGHQPAIDIIKSDKYQIVSLRRNSHCMLKIG